MLEPLGDDAKRQSLDAGDGLIAVCPIGHHASQCRHFGQPATVVLTFKFDREDHDGYCTIRTGCPTSAAPDEPRPPLGLRRDILRGSLVSANR